MATPVSRKRVDLDAIAAERFEVAVGGKVFVATPILDQPISRQEKIADVQERLSDPEQSQSAMLEFIKFCIPEFGEADMSQLTGRQLSALVEALGEAKGGVGSPGSIAGSC